MLIIKYLDEIQIELSCLPFAIFNSRELKFYLELVYEPELNSLLENIKAKYEVNEESKAVKINIKTENK